MGLELQELLLEAMHHGAPFTPARLEELVVQHIWDASWVHNSEGEKVVTVGPPR